MRECVRVCVCGHTDHCAVLPCIREGGRVSDSCQHRVSIQYHRREEKKGLARSTRSLGRASTRSTCTTHTHTHTHQTHTHTHTHTRQTHTHTHTRQIHKHTHVKHTHHTTIPSQLGEFPRLTRSLQLLSISYIMK